MSIMARYILKVACIYKSGQKNVSNFDLQLENPDNKIKKN